MEKQTMTERDIRTATDIADTILRARFNCGSLPTIESMRGFITAETNIRTLDNKQYARLMAEEIIRINNEWFDKESEPE